MQISNKNINLYNNTSFCGVRKLNLSKNKFQNLLQQGLNDTKIADMFGVSTKTVASLRNKFGIEPLKKIVKIKYDEYDFYYLRTLIDEGNSLSQIAEFYKTNVGQIRKVLKYYNLQTQEATFAAVAKKEEVIKLINSGKTQEEIAEALFLDDKTSLTHILKKFGLEMPIRKVDKVLPIEKISDLIFGGMKIDEIAQKYKISTRTIKDKMKSSGFWEVYENLYQPHDISKREILDLINSGYKMSEIAEINHVSLYQLVKYMVKNKILKTDVPLKDLVNSVKNGLSVKKIALKHEVFETRVYKMLTQNNLTTKGQQKRISLPKGFVLEKIIGCTTYKELGEKLNISAQSAKRLITKYGIKFKNKDLNLPKIENVKKTLRINPKISADELAKSLSVDTTVLEKFLKRHSQISIYTPHKINDFRSFEFAKWTSSLMKHGDSPVQIGELTGISSSKAREIIEKLISKYKNNKNFEMVKIPDEKPSPSSADIIRSFIDATGEYSSKREKSYTYGQIHLAKDFVKAKICTKFQISDTTFEYLLNKYDLAEIFDKYANKMADRK